MKLAFTAVLMGFCLIALAQARYDTIPNQPEHYRNQLSKFQLENKSSANIIFLGNSITEGGNWRAMLKDSSVLNRGISGDNTYGVLNRLEEVTRHKPAKLFLLIGINDLSKSTPQATVLQNIFSIVGQVHAQSPKTQVYVHSLLPVNPGVKGFPPRFSKQGEISEINGQLKKYDEALKYTYVDIHAEFQDDRLNLDARFTKDGLHLNAAGYAHWMAYLKKQKCL